MANELLSVPVAAGTLGIAALGIGWVCRKAHKLVPQDKLPLMGVLGAFVFAAQMVNFQLPGMPGTSGHLVGAVLLAIILGPYAAAIVMTSIVIVQCLIFQDGGLLALGCNVINMALVPVFVGYYVYGLIAAGRSGKGYLWAGSIVASLAAVQAGAILVPIQAALSGVVVVPLATFMATMVGVHMIIGILEGVITAVVLGYLAQVRPDVVEAGLSGRQRFSMKAVYASFAIAALLVGGGLSLLASAQPDGLEWSYMERPDQPDFEPFVHNDSETVAAVDAFHGRIAPMPDYSLRTDEDMEASAAWTSLGGVAGSGLTMLLVWGICRVVVRRRSPAEA